MIPDPWLGHCTDYCVVLLYFTWTKPIKIKVSFSCAQEDGTYGEELLYTNNGSFKWRWVVRFLNAATTFPSDKEQLLPIECEAGLASEPVWMFCWSEKSSVLTRNLTQIVYPITWSLFPSFISIQYLCISSVAKRVSM